MRLDLPRGRRATIGLTPLIDVVFILLLFFMLTTRFGQPQAMSLSVPGEGGTASAASADAAVLRLRADATVGLPDGRDVPPAALGADPAVRALLAGAVPVRLEVDDGADLQSLVTTLDRLEAIGLADVVVRGLGR